MNKNEIKEIAEKLEGYVESQGIEKPYGTVQELSQKLDDAVVAHLVNEAKGKDAKIASLEKWTIILGSALIIAFMYIAYRL